MDVHGRWHGKKCYFGLHYDLHAQKGDKELGTHCSPRELAPMLKLMAPDWVQTDCKGHAGYTSWFSKTPGASVPPGLRKDALKQWRQATRQLGLPLHCHYSGIWDTAAGKKHPNGAVDEIPAVGPVTIRMKAVKRPKKVSLAFEKTPIQWKHAAGRLTVTVPAVHIHAAVVVE